MIDFPQNPVVGDIFTSGGIAWVWDGVKWTFEALASAGTYLPLVGGTLTGPVDTTSTFALIDAPNFLLGGGNPGDVLVTDGAAGLTWDAVAPFIDAPVDGNSYARSNNVWLSGGIFNRPVYINGPNSFALVAPTATQHTILSGIGVPPGAVLWRWSLALGDGTAEGPINSNNGSNLVITRFSDIGGQIDAPFAINRATGITTIANLSAPQAIGDNCIINGDMRIDQRGVASGGGTANDYTVDRWQFQASQVGNGFWQRVASAVPGFPYYLNFTSSSAYASLAADFFFFQQALEGDVISDFAWGTANAQPVTLSFWAFSSLTGTFSGCVKNYAATRSYPFIFSVSTANSWTKITITIPGDTGGTWVLSGNGGALYIVFDLGSGSTYRGPAGVWASANYQGVTGAVSVVEINGAAWGVTGVKLEIGSVATPFNRQSLAKSMADCQRYYSTVSAHLLTTATAASEYVCTTAALPVTMRTAPTLAINFFTGIPDSQVNPPSIDGITINGFRFYTASSAAGTVQCSRTMTASAEL